MTQEPYPVKKKKSPWIWISLGCIGLVAILGIVLIVFTMNFLRSDEGKQFTSGIQRTQTLARSLPEISAGMEKYVAEKGDFPATLDELAGYVGAEELEKIKAEMTYTKPAKDAPPETVVLTTGMLEFMQGSKQEIFLQKDFEFFQATKQPLRK
jgi:hypothetical protein